VCRKIEPDHQINWIAPLLENAAQIFEWLHDDVSKASIISAALDAAAEDINGLARREIVFRSPDLHVRWEELLRAASKTEDPHLHLVSLDDIDYWVEARDSKFSEARKYENAVREFRGTKRRILIFEPDSLDTEIKQARAAAVIQWMQEANIEVSAILRGRVDLSSIEPDFGVLSGFVVSRFEGPDDAPARALRQAFASEVVKQYQEHWSSLQNNASIWRAHLGSFEEWAKEMTRE
jgi:hypothetical protein